MTVTPNILLKANIAYPTEYAWWEYDDGTSDPFYGVAYQWHTTLFVEPQLHSSHVTDTPMFFTSDDVKVGDWFASSEYGRALQIVEILSSDGERLEVILEDVERYNLFTNPEQTGSGVIPDGAGVIFRLGENGLPILGPVSDGYLPHQTVDDLMARFISRNLTEHVLVKQVGHSFNVGDVIYADFADNDGYEKVTSATLDKAIGIITEVGTPGLDYFHYRPIGKLLTNVKPPLSGQHGDVHYLDPSSPTGLTTTRPTGRAVPLYLQLELPTKAILLERGIESGETSGDIDTNETHKYDVEEVTDDQTIFILPANAETVMYMSINGIENENFTFDENTKVVVFDPVATGYGVESSDEVFFIYKS